ncbi:HAD family hydrolase [Streptomyces chrestomyceticus]|uniref:HAD family hydrolase n=1 Tax=Streptomyces chrestomyceticus TaxID=68185 RepID=UPI0019D2EB9A|nr:HAD family hydrolase [Streptomyces chrestomyceticus]
MTIEAVLWDVDDTLFDYTGSDRVGALRHIEAEGLLARYADAECALGRWRECMEAAFGRFLAGEVGFLEHRRERARAFLGGALSDDEADAWFGRYVALYEAAWTLFPDSVQALTDLAPLARQGVLSNSSVRNQDRKLRALGIREHFEVVLCADEVGHAKPAAEAFLAACDAMGLAPERVVYVGDKLDVDAIGARDAGLGAVWVDRGGVEGDVPDGVTRIGGLGELPGLVRGLIGFGASSTFG